MAIRQDMIVAIRKAAGGQVRVANVEDKYPTCVYPADPNKVNQSILPLPCSSLLCSPPR
jgi:N-acetylgalactosamine kinase